MRAVAIKLGHDCGPDALSRCVTTCARSTRRGKVIVVIMTNVAMNFSRTATVVRSTIMTLLCSRCVGAPVIAGLRMTDLAITGRGRVVAALDGPVRITAGCIRVQVSITWSGQGRAIDVLAYIGSQEALVVLSR